MRMYNRGSIALECPDSCFRSSTTSARSDVYASVEEFGRTYHGYKAGSKIMHTDKV